MSDTSDLDFCFPIQVLENDKLKLTPFIASIHGPAFFAAQLKHPEIWRFLAYGPYTSLDDLQTEFVEGVFRQNSNQVLFAVIDKMTLPGAEVLAGVISIMDASPTNLSAEIGWILILPEFHRTHVTTNAVGLLLHYLLELPSAGGLGLRRVAWKTHGSNKASAAAGERLGFVREGVLRWDRVLREGKEGKESRLDSKEGCLGRDTVVLSLCWDDWEGGGKERVRTLMAKKYSHGTH